MLPSSVLAVSCASARRAESCAHQAPLSACLLFPSLLHDSGKDTSTLERERAFVFAVETKSGWGEFGASSERELPGKRHDLSPRAQEARPLPRLSASLLLARLKKVAVEHRASSRAERDLKGVLNHVLVVCSVEMIVSNHSAKWLP